MLNDHQFEESVGFGESPAKWIREFSDLFAQRVSDWGHPRRCLTEPLLAIHAAWEYEHDLESGLIEDLRGIFPETLAERCGRSQDTLTGDPRIALGVFMACLVVSLRVWRSEPPPEGLYGSVAAHWCARHPEIFSKVQEAHRSRVSYPHIEEVGWTAADVVSAHSTSKELPKRGKLELSSTVHFIRQRTWTQAAQTAAYALFGDFLLTEAETIGFCGYCAMPFLRGQKKLFHSSECARSRSAIRSHDAKARVSRRKTFRKAAKALRELLQGRSGARSGWRIKVQRAAGMQTRDGRQNRTLGAYIKASRTDSGSPEREKLLQSLQDASGVLEKKEGSKEIESLQQELDAFLLDIQKAEEIQQRSKRK
jgi:hypothetical protein